MTAVNVHGQPIITTDELTGEDHFVDGWEVIIGLEVHVELQTQTKMFAGTPNLFGGEPNTRVGTVDLALPGTLPTINKKGVEGAIAMGLAMDCSISPVSEFARKNYFYPDMPKDYQISQASVAICQDGHLDITLPDGTVRRIGVERIHIEEDTGKSTHVGGTGRIHGADYSLLDYNRATVPLLECVSRPDMRTPEEAQAYLAEVRAIVEAIGISDAKLEEGSMRCDANVSVHKPGTPFGVRAEIKNLNSIRSLGRAITYEVRRQIHEISQGVELVMETRHWDEVSGTTSSMRRKETQDDYRYFPDPDLPQLRPSTEWIEAIRATLPELPQAVRDRLRLAGVDYDSAIIIYDNNMVGLYDDAIAHGAVPAEVAKWLTNEISGWQNEHNQPAHDVLPGSELAALLALVADNTLAVKGARAILEDVMAGKGSVDELKQGHMQISDEATLGAIIDEVIAANEDAAAKVRAGNKKAMGALVGPVMAKTQGKANPKMVNELLAKKLL